MINIPQRWSDNAQNDLAHFSLKLDGDILHIDATVKSTPAGVASKLGGFKEGLWEADVFEVFVKQANGDKYVEFNFGYTGEWWGAYFGAVRRRDGVLGEDLALVNSVELQDGAWRLTAQIELARLPFSVINNGGIIGNVTAIIYPEGQAEKYLTLVDIDTAEPDYHQPNQFVALAV